MRRRRRSAAKTTNTKAGYVILGALVALVLILYIKCRTTNLLEEAKPPTGASASPADPGAGSQDP